MAPPGARALSFVLLMLGACWPEPSALLDDTEVETASAPVLLERLPDGVIPPDAPVEVRWGETLALLGVPQVLGPAGPVDCDIEERPNGVVVAPRPRWPEDQVMSVDLDGALETIDGFLPEILPVIFRVGSATAAAGSALPVVRRPVPGHAAPLNLAWISIGGAPEASELHFASVDGLERSAKRSGQGQGRVYRWTVPGRCGGLLCPEATYRLVRPEGAPAGPLGAIQTGTVSDTVAPRIERFELLLAPGRLIVDVACNEVVRLEGAWVADEARGVFVPLQEPGQRLRAQAVPTPPSDRPIEVLLQLEDLAGQRTSTQALARLPAEPHIRVSELVPTPRSDWGDSEPEGEPFDPWPGGGSVSSADEWVELVNVGSSALDLGAIALELHAIDGSPSVTVVASAPALRFGDGGSARAWAPGEALVVRTRGDMAQRDLRLELRAGSVPLDSVVLARSAGADHPGGSPPDARHEALARGPDGVFRWCEPTPGDPRPSTRCRFD